MAWHPNSSWLAYGEYPQGIQVWDVTTRLLCWVGQANLVWFDCFAWSPDGTQLVSGGNDGCVYLWESADGTRREWLEAHHGKVMSLAWSPDGRLLASGSGNKESGELFVWDMQHIPHGSGRGQAPPLRSLPMRTFTGHPAMVYAVVWSPSGDELISGGADGTLRWWDVESEECVAMREAHQGAIRALQVSPDGKSLASCGEDGAIRIWDLESFECVRTLRHDRPYERLNITGIRGLTEAEIASLQALGAIEEDTP